MNKKGTLKIFFLVALIIVVLIVAIGLISYFMNKGKTPCPLTPDDQVILRMPLPGTLAGGKQTGAEDHTFVNSETISVCCADVSSGPSPEREFKDCIHYNEGGKQDYQVVWERKNGKLVKIKENLPWQGAQCVYDFDESGEWSGRWCE